LRCSSNVCDVLTSRPSCRSRAGSGLDDDSRNRLVNHSTLIAWWITWFGYFDVLLPIGVALAIVAIVVPAWRSRMIFASSRY